MRATAPKRKAQGAWPRVHLVYFLLAAFDLVAVAGGLYLSYALSSVFDATIAAGAAWNGRAAAILELGKLADALNMPSRTVLASRDVARESANLKASYDTLLAQYDVISWEIRSNLMPEDKAAVYKALSQIPMRAKFLMIYSDMIVAKVAAGDLAGAAGLVEVKDGENVKLRQLISDAAVYINGMTARHSAASALQVEKLKSYEYLIGLGIVLMVGCVACYGHFIGRLMRRKYQELQAAHGQSAALAGELQGLNEGVTALNVELAGNVRKLKDAQDEIIRKGKLAQLGQLTATVAHELRNPLGAVRTSAFLLERKVKDKGLGVEAQLERINTGVMRCDGIITQLLDFARSSAPQCEMVEFDGWLNHLVEEEARKLPAVVTVACDLGLGAIKAPIDPARMARVVINLLSNACEAMVGKGDDPSKFTTSAPRIDIATRRAARGIEISIADNGPGIAQENLRKILEPLFTTKNFGTGLGLPAVEKILEQHGGGLEIASTLGRGATFTAWIPAEPRTPQKEAA